MNIIKSKIFRDASHATNFPHLECVKTKKWIKILIYSPLLLKCLVKPIDVCGVSCVKPSDVQPHYFISLEGEHVLGALHHRNQKLNPHLQMLHVKSPALCPPGLERFPISLLSPGCDPDLSATTFVLDDFCMYLTFVLDAPRIKVLIISVCVPSVEASCRWSSHHCCRTTSQSKQVICLAA